MKTLLAVLPLLACCSGQGLELVKVIAMSRHSVRAPSVPGTNMSMFSKDGRYWYTDWVKDWGAQGPLYLTEHGSQIAERRGEWWRQQYGNLTTKGGCGGVTMYADGADSTQRDLATAQGFIDGFFPQNECNQTVHDGLNATQWIFNTLVPISPDVKCSGGNKVSVDGTRGGSGRQLSEKVHPLTDFSVAIDCCQPVMCNLTDAPCQLQDIPEAYVAQSKMYMNGITMGGFLTEWVELMYLNNMTWNAVAQGVTLYDLIEQTRELHTFWFETWITQYMAKSMGSQMLAHMKATLQQIVLGVETPGLLSSPSDSIVLYFGHDSNIAFLHKLLGLEWVPLGWGSTMIPPMAMLIFTVHKAPSTGGYFVKAAFETQRPDQMRELQRLSPSNPADSSYVSIPACSHGEEGSCPFSDFIDILDGAILEPCTKPF
eukprot:TRINITY_DN4328_c6_g1_i1.p1 TRINITY_DN4328_c6_g1~~TRINITY_DN4328_c6_g1_i1.p1  ORF type:complete len:428 (+),score=100.35 TRINITY_DN4328_c6_g1_i1:54-1337(+)